MFSSEVVYREDSLLPKWLRGRRLQAVIANSEPKTRPQTVDDWHLSSGADEELYFQAEKTPLYEMSQLFHSKGSKTNRERFRSKKMEHSGEYSSLHEW